VVESITATAHLDSFSSGHSPDADKPIPTRAKQRAAWLSVELRFRACLRPLPCQHSHAMSGRTRKRLIIACVVVLVCGAVAFALMRRPRADLVFAKVGLETNGHGRSFVRTLVSNASPHLLQISFTREPLILGHTPEVPPRFQLQPFSGIQQLFEVSSIRRNIRRRTPCRLTAHGEWVFTGSLSDYVRSHFGQWPAKTTVTLEIPE